MAELLRWTWIGRVGGTPVGNEDDDVTYSIQTGLIIYGELDMQMSEIVDKCSEEAVQH